MTMLTPLQIVVIVAIAGLVLAAVIAAVRARVVRRRHAEIERRFGPEYERAVAEFGDSAHAERELYARERHVQKLHLRRLSERDRARFTAEWERLQALFLDDPAVAARRADALIVDVMAKQGYRAEAVDERVRELSVEHATVVQHYRAACALAEANREGRANTEELRQAMVHYRAIITDLLHEAPRGAAELRPARA
ncbi:MAG TPA: hypothetical protein VGQ57_17360 [Polyangiaceae bacterium]|jgi:hypothetical protein|nr:hypothetical protein [Polyangiaceae bacterium]